LIGPEFPVTFTEKWRTAVQGSDGCIYGLPFNALQVLKLNCAESTAQLIGDVPQSEQKWKAAELGAGNFIWAIPYHAGQLLRISMDGEVDIFGVEPPAPKQDEVDPYASGSD